MIRSSIVFPVSLHRRFLIAAKQRLDRMYKVLKEMEGIGDPDITDASTTINETLYGENGAWRGDAG